MPDIQNVFTTITELPNNTSPADNDYFPIENADGTKKTTKGDFLAEVYRRLQAIEGFGGYLDSHNFGSASPAQQDLTEYAVSNIWPGYTDFVYNAANPADSTFNDADGNAHTCAEIFSATKVINTFNNNLWSLTNTQQTQPAVFSWQNLGIYTVNMATSVLAGILKLYNEFGQNQDGAITQAFITNNAAPKYPIVNVGNKSGTYALSAAETLYDNIVITGALTITLPNVSSDGKAHEIIAIFKTGSSLYTVNFGTTNYANALAKNFNTGKIANTYYMAIYTYAQTSGWSMGLVRLNQ